MSGLVSAFRKCGGELTERRERTNKGEERHGILRGAVGD